MSMATEGRADIDILRLPSVKATQSEVAASCLVMIEADELLRMGKAGHTLIIAAPCNLSEVTVSAGLSAAALRRTP